MRNLTSLLASSALLLTLTATALAQHSHQHHQTPQSPYAGYQTRTIKALSPEQIEGLKAGHGLTLALAAELNNYPGPVHVIDLAKPLALSDEQQTRIAALYAEMKREAVALGETLITQEAALDRQFAERSVTPESLESALKEIGDTQTKLRYTHLKYHLATVKILDAHQIARYSQLRGYAESLPR